VGVDQPDDADLPPDGRADHRDDQSGGGRAGRAGGVQVETRARQEYYADLRVAVSAEESVTAQRTAAREQAAAEKWEGTVKESRWMWTEYQRTWPPEERPPPDRSLKPPDNTRVEAACDRITGQEQEKITPAMRALESQDPDRHLVGFEHRLKGRDRIKEKVIAFVNDLTISSDEAVSLVHDAIRYTFQYKETSYTRGVQTDIGRLKGQGFELEKLKNFWSDEQYKAINSQWIDPDSGQRFEVQFHTRISFEAKQLTHGAYERLRTRQPDKFEQMVLEAFQKKVTAEVPVPPGADGIPNYPERGADAR